MNGVNFEVLSENPFAQALAVSTVMAVFMIGAAMGIVYMLDTGKPALPISVMLLIFAVVFITGSVFFEGRGADQFGSLVGGCITGFGATFASVSFVGGVVYAFNGGFKILGFEQLVSALAVCMIASMLIMRFLSYKFQNQYA